jgi:hypothetical protein
MAWRVFLGHCNIKVPASGVAFRPPLAVQARILLQPSVHLLQAMSRTAGPPSILYRSVASKTPSAGDLYKDQNSTWVDNHAPAWAVPYLKLMRIDRPIGG